MTYLIGFLTLVFLGLTIAVIVRMQSVLKSTRTEAVEDDAPVANNNANAIMCLLFLIFGSIGGVWSYFHYEDTFLLPVASPHGRITDHMFWVSMGILSIALVVVNTLIFFFSWKYSYNKNRKAKFYADNHTLEIVWTAIPAVVMAYLVFTGYQAWTNIMAEAPSNAQVVEIMGKQFNWWVRYGGNDDNKLGKYNYKLIDDTNNNPMGIDFSDANSFDDFIHNGEMHLIVNRPVALKIRARDVLHSVFIPHMRVKMDAVPGMPTKFQFTPDKTTQEMRAELENPKFDYEIACTEVCGRGHFSMRLRLIVEDEASFNKWKAAQKPVLATILENKPDFMSKIPQDLKAKAMKYMPAPAEPVVPVAKTKTVPTGSTIGASASL
jgi:cytochrome c oxidase subunit II